MAITHFTISTPSVEFLDIRVSGVPITPNAAIPIADQANLTATNISEYKAENLAKFGYKVSKDGGITWSNEAFCTINDFADTNLPESIDEVQNYTVPSQTVNLETLFNLNSSVDRVRIESFGTSNGVLKFENNPVFPGDEFFVYTLPGMTFDIHEGSASPYQQIFYRVGNHEGYNMATLYSIRIDLNLLGKLIISTSNLEFENFGNYAKQTLTEKITIYDGIVGKECNTDVDISCDRWDDPPENTITVDGTTYNSPTANFNVNNTLNNEGKADIVIQHVYIDENGEHANYEGNFTLIDVDDDPANVDTGNDYVSSTMTVNGMSEGNSMAVTSYRSSYENDGFIYGGYNDGVTPVIKRKTDQGVITQAQGVTNLESDWDNRLNLTYS